MRNVAQKNMWCEKWNIDEIEVIEQNTDKKQNIYMQKQWNENLKRNNLKGFNRKRWK